MTMPHNSEKELLHLAKTSTELNVLYDLHKSPNMNIRRAVARNKNITESIANKLVSDPVLNVSYMASLNPNCTSKREFNTPLDGCVICEEDEREIYCVDCPNRR